MHLSCNSSHEKCTSYKRNKNWIVWRLKLKSRYNVKKGLRFPRPKPGCPKPNSPRTGIIQLFPARESLVSDIPAGDRKIMNLFYSVRKFNKFHPNINTFILITPSKPLLSSVVLVDPA
jgi:hypothetical protein